MAKVCVGAGGVRNQLCGHPRGNKLHGNLVAQHGPCAGAGALPAIRHDIAAEIPGADAGSFGGCIVGRDVPRDIIGRLHQHLQQLVPAVDKLARTNCDRGVADRQVGQREGGGHRSRTSPLHVCTACGGAVPTRRTRENPPVRAACGGPDATGAGESARARGLRRS